MIEYSLWVWTVNNERQLLSDYGLSMAAKSVNNMHLIDMHTWHHSSHATHNKSNSTSKSASIHQSIKGWPMNSLNSLSASSYLCQRCGGRTSIKYTANVMSINLIVRVGPPRYYIHPVYTVLIKGFYFTKHWSDWRSFKVSCLLLERIESLCKLIFAQSL